jgi:hypothetical protein
MESSESGDGSVFPDWANSKGIPKGVNRIPHSVFRIR